MVAPLQNPESGRDAFPLNCGDFDMQKRVWRQSLLRRDSNEQSSGSQQAGFVVALGLGPVEQRDDRYASGSLGALNVISCTSWTRSRWLMQTPIRIHPPYVIPVPSAACGSPTDDVPYRRWNPRAALPPRSRPRPAAVRSPATHCAAGNCSDRFRAASSVCAIRELRVSIAGACRDGSRSNRLLLAARAIEYEVRTISRRAEPDAGRGRLRGGRCLTI